MCRRHQAGRPSELCDCGHVPGKRKKRAYEAVPSKQPRPGEENVTLSLEHPRTAKGVAHKAIARRRGVDVWTVRKYIARLEQGAEASGPTCVGTGNPCARHREVSRRSPYRPF